MAPTGRGVSRLQILAKIAVIALRGIYSFFKLFIKPCKKITLLSRQSNTPSVDFELLAKSIKESGSDTEIKMLTKKIPSGLLGKAGYAFHMLKQMYHIASSRVIITDGYCIAVCVLNHKKEQKIIQIWHALNIVKKFGYAALDKPWGHSSATAKTLCMHRNYDYIVACSEKSASVLAESFNAPVEKTVLLPLPRIDYILNTPKKNDEIKAVYPNIFKKPILLYAPTFRGEKVNLSNLQNIVNLEKYNVVVKLHPADKQGIDSSVNKEILCDREFSSFDWMKSCEVLITDYSGMGFEAMLLNKKVYYYLYDYDDYTEKNGLALDLFSEAIAPYVARSADELCEVLKKDYDFSLEKRYVEKYLSVGTENCSKRLAEFVIGLLKE